MALLRAHVVPHPPLIVPTVGKGREREIPQTCAAYKRVAESVASDKPDLIIFITPHGKIYEDYIHISPEAAAAGDFSSFGAPKEQGHLLYDTAFIQCLTKYAEQAQIPAGTLGGRGAEALDHGVLVPLSFISWHYHGYKAVRISISGLSFDQHYTLGMCLQKALAETKRNAVIIASGDLSHKLLADGSYGYAPEGPAFDASLCEALKKGDFLQLLDYDPSFCDAAAECGLRSFIMMAGAFDGLQASVDFGSYEGTFGVGYAVCTFTPGDTDKNRCFLAKHKQRQAEKMRAIRQQESAYVQLARQTLEHYVTTSEILTCPADLPDAMQNQHAGTFVSIKKDGRLRGCIGTTEPYRQNIAEEIMHNAISAGTQDPRFDPVTADELAQLVYSVDVLSPSEPIADKKALDPARYGVIVSQGRKRGLLLPNLEGVDTVEQQISIALNKAGIPQTADYVLFRFEVVRYT